MNTLASQHGPVVKLQGNALAIKRFAALTTIILPFAGTVAAVFLLVTGHFTAVDIWLFVVMYIVHVGGVTIGLHRYLAHRSFRTSRWFQDVLMVAGSLAAQGPLLFWVATHRCHHRYADKKGDPHSPNLHGTSWPNRARGLWYAHIPWMLSPEASRWSRFAPDVMRDRSLVMHHRLYPAWVMLGLALPAAGGFALGQTLTSAITGLVFGGLARIFVANQAAWCVGSICHAFGSRRFDTPDKSTNNFLVALVTFGEGLQNNHHAFPNSFRHAVRWWEPDASGWAIAALARLKIVWGLHQPTPAQVSRRGRTA